MNRVAWWLANGVSRFLDTAEREIVVGDLTESHCSGPTAFGSILGLVVRRQLALWSTWRPWVALIGVVAVAGFSLSKFLGSFAGGLFEQLRTYFEYGVHYGTGVTPMQDACHLIILALALIFWSWASGFVLASLSGRAFWLTAALFYFVVKDSFLTYSILSRSKVIVNPHHPLWFQMAFWLLPLSPMLLVPLLVLVAFAGWGAYRGGRGSPLGFKAAIILAGFVAILIWLVFWSGGWYVTARMEWSGGVWPATTTPWPWRLLPILLVSWPFAYIAVGARRFKARVRPTR